MDTRWHFVRELQDQGAIEVVFVKTADNWADGFTKNLGSDTHGRHSGITVSCRKGFLKQ